MPINIYPLTSQPGIQRDGTDSDSDRYSDGEWVRFQRGRPKKMNGYRQVTGKLNGPVRSCNVWSRQSLIQITTFSASGVEAVQVDKSGIGSALFNRTPASFVITDDFVWQNCTMYDAAVGSTKTLLLAHAAPNLTSIDNGTVGDIYYGDASGTDALVAIGASMRVSGGIVAIAPYLVTYGSDGYVAWSNANEPRNFTTGDYGSSRVTGSKIVKGLPIRGQGQSPSALLWSLDSVIKMSYVGGQSIFRFDTISSEASILSSNSVIEYDGDFYWIGIDRFMVYNGRVQELPNSQNINWFFDNLNYDHRQKVHAMKIPRYGEIWWFYPRGSNTECSHAVIYNVREKYWYDVELPRSSGFYSQTFRYPIMTESSTEVTTYRLSLTGVSGTFSIGELVTGGTSTAVGNISKILDGDYYISVTSGMLAYSNGETVTGTSGASGTVSVAPATITNHSLWLHEIGKNLVKNDNEIAIESSYQSSDIGFLSGGPTQNPGAVKDNWLRLVRIEPDFVSVGNMTVEVIGFETAQSSSTTSASYDFTGETEKIDMREQQRIMHLKFSNNDINGDFEAGKIRLHVEEGDARN